MQQLLVIGNISLDRIHRPGHPAARQLGGAALHLSAATAHAGLRAAPVAVIGSDLAHLPTDLRLPPLDWSLIHQAAGPSAAFTIHYDQTDTVTLVEPDYGVAANLTTRALQVIASHPRAHFHVSCRHPLGLPAVLAALTRHGCVFSVDFHLPSAPQLIPAAAPWLPHATTVFVNAEEHALLLRTATQVRELVVTDGPRPARVLLSGCPLPSRTPPALAAPRHITGAGDTAAGTYLAHRARGARPADALACAVGAASRYLTRAPLALPAPGYASS